MPPADLTPRSCATPAQSFVDAVAAAPDGDALVAACAEFAAARRDGAARPAGNAFRTSVAAALRTHLQALGDHPRYRDWLQVYFGERRAQFRSPLQQPGWLYYPALPPQPWFATDEVAPLLPLRPRIAEVAAELRAWLGAPAESAPGPASRFAPYVEAAAARDTRWRGLAGDPRWSSIHLIRGGVRDEALLAELPRTAALLAAAPLAQCPPHAPECFVSRLFPGVVLPPHHGVSNIKLTVHLPVELPASGCSLTVGGETRSWREDDFLIFDDAFLHSAENRTDLSRTDQGSAPQARTVLIFDVWHPRLHPAERDALAQAVRAIDAVMGVAGDWF